MGEIQAQGAVKEATIEAVVIRADGTREELGVIAEYHRPLSLLERIRSWLRLS